MYFRQILHEKKSCASYIIGCQTESVCAVVDPQVDPDFYLEKVHDSGMTIVHIFETHIQADHRSSSQDLAKKSGALIHVGPGAGVKFSHREFHDGEEIKMGGRRFKIFHTPGHTPEHVCILVDDWFLLTGDALFVGDVGRVDLEPDGDQLANIERGAGQLYGGLQRILTLPDWIEIYPAHYGGSVCGRGIDGKPISTIGRERIKNPALQLSREEFMAFQKAEAPQMPKDAEEIKRYNVGMNQWLATKRKA